MRRPIYLLLIVAFLCACDSQTSADSDVALTDLLATPGKSLATLEFPPTPVPTATFAGVIPTPLPTLDLPTVVALDHPPTQPIGGATPLPVTPTLNVTCAADPPLPFAAIWVNNQHAKTMLHCAVGDPQTVSGIWQSFEHGAMFWRESDKSIFVISDSAIRRGQPTDVWWRIADDWQPGDPENDPLLQPPSGLLQPARSFGLIWREYAFIREAVGWANGEETRFDSQWMTFEGGWMMTGPEGSPIYVMQPLDPPPYTTGIHLAPQP